MTPGTKKCTKCKKRLPLSAFWKEVHGKYGVKSQCKECHYKYRKKTRRGKPATQKTYTPKSYKGPAFVEIRFCKECGKLLDQPWPLKGVVRKEYDKRDRDYWHLSMCNTCRSKKVEEDIDRHYRVKALRKDRDRKKYVYYCPVCGKAFSIRSYQLRSYKFLHTDYPFYEVPPFTWECSRECHEKKEYAMNIGPTGIKGVGVRAFTILASKTTDEWAERHNEYQAALLAKEYTVLKRLRIDTKKEVRNGAS